MLLEVLAHAEHDINSFAVGFMHPLHGLDHLLAMVTVGLLSARMTPRHMWSLPAMFVLFMFLGGLLGLVWGSDGVTAIEWGISGSVMLFGLLAALLPKVNVWLGNGIVAVFAICHGHAHVAEMGDAETWGYFGGMLVATALLHLGGLVAGVGLKHVIGEWTIRAAGAAVAAAFVLIITGVWN
jgi:urease accessory protein